jgi:hypothetical protein
MDNQGFPMVRHRARSLDRCGIQAATTTPVPSTVPDRARSLESHHGVISTIRIHCQSRLFVVAAHLATFRGPGCPVFLQAKYRGAGRFRGLARPTWGTLSA